METPGKLVWVAWQDFSWHTIGVGLYWSLDWVVEDYGPAGWTFSISLGPWSIYVGQENTLLLRDHG